MPDPIPAPVEAAIRSVARPVCAYVYDTAVARDRVAALRAALPHGTTILYAMKANGHPDVVRAMAAAADGVEVASGGELRIAVDAGARRIAFGGPAKTDDELTAAVAVARDGVDLTINCESGYEIRRLTRIVGAEPPRRLSVALRVNRSRGAAVTGSHAMTGVATPFGIDEHDLSDAIAAAAGLPVCGFHLHAVSNNLDAGAHAAFIRDCLDWSIAAAARFGIELRQVNAGGGFGIDYTGGTAFDLDRMRADLAGVDLSGDLSSGGLAGIDLVVEPGRFLAAPIGWYAAEVIDVKRNLGRWFAVLRGGTHHFRLPAAWGYSHPFAVLPVDEWTGPEPRPEVRDAAVDAVGELCTPRDVLTRDQPVRRVRAGDILVFPTTGGYAWDISHHEFLRHAYPQMILI
jgi:diaminopimelate decarboxylase